MARFRRATAIASILALAVPLAAHAQSEVPIYSFKPKFNKYVPWQLPPAGLLVMPNGTGYGVTTQRGTYGYGTVYQTVPPDATHPAWRISTIYNFVGNTEGAADGLFPAGKLVMQPPGLQAPRNYLYGTTTYGGFYTNANGGGSGPCGNIYVAAVGCGTIFALMPSSGSGATVWQEEILHSFCGSQKDTCPAQDGEAPLDLVVDASGALYGVTKTTVFQARPFGTTPFTTMYTFGTNANDGGTPNSPLLVSRSGIVYGTTKTGGLYGGGTIFSLTPTSGASGWTYNQIYSFGGFAGEGTAPNGGLVDSSVFSSTPGIYLSGTTESGGANGLGTIFTVGQEFLGTQFQDNIFYSFAGGSDGANPIAGMFQADDGSFWGTTSQGGTTNPAYACGSGCGTVFEVARVSHFTHFVYTYKQIAAFTGYNNADGATPFTQLFPDGSGTLYGLTSTGGAYAAGTIFALADAAAIYTVAKPTFSPKGGGYTTGQTVTITDTTPAATICYTTDGETPTASSPTYTSPISVAANETVKAIAFFPGFVPSAIGSATYTIEPRAATPTFSPNGGGYTGPQSVAIDDATGGATIYYTTDGSDPTTSSAVYSNPIAVSTTDTVKALAVAANYLPSSIGSATYTIEPRAAEPTFSPGSGSYTGAQPVTINDTTGGATIYYTTDGSDPTKSSAVYSGPITVGSSETVKALAVAPDFLPSSIGVAKYTIQ